MPGNRQPFQRSEPALSPTISAVSLIPRRGALTEHCALAGTDPRRLRMLPGVLFAGLCALLLSICGETDSTTELGADGSGTHTITDTAAASDLGYVDGGLATIETAINDNNSCSISYSGYPRQCADRGLCDPSD